LKTARLALAIVLTLASPVALANVGIGFLMLTVPVILIALLPVIPLEAVLLQRLLSLPFKRALYLSFIANLWSTLAGSILSFPFDLALGIATGSSGGEFTRGAVSVMLVPMFFITWWLEYSILKKRLAEIAAPRLKRSTFAANLVSYIAMIACALIFLPEHGPTPSRAYTSEAILVASSLRTSIHAFWMEHKRFPSSLKELGETAPPDKHYAVSLDANGRISVRINREVRELQGKHVVVWPVVEGDKLEWKCGSPDIDVRYLRSTCREPTP
jgi:hypothetical protein